GSRRPHPLAADAQGLRRAPRRPRDARRTLRPRTLGAQPQPDQPVALPRPRAGGARAPQAGLRAGVGAQARPRPDAGGRLRAADGRSGRRRGGPGRGRLGGLHRPAGGARPRARRLLAHAGHPARDRRARGVRSRRGRARPRPAAPRHGAGREAGPRPRAARRHPPVPRL
ncbi:MAG: hypothetical protein AVDCRST_MAG38-1397, partial [uncultured Solirubrobacteraceae bacterium]